MDVTCVNHDVSVDTLFSVNHESIVISLCMNHVKGDMLLHMNHMSRETPVIAQESCVTCHV